MQQMNLSVHDYGETIDIETWAGLVAHVQSMPAVMHLNDRLRMTSDEVTRFKRRYPRFRAIADQAIRRLCWPGVGNLPLAIYRAHVHELLGRIQREESIQPATVAELLVALMSQAAPPNRAAAALFSQLLREIGCSDVVHVQEPWAGAAERLQKELRDLLSGAPSRSSLGESRKIGAQTIRA